MSRYAIALIVGAIALPTFSGCSGKPVEATVTLEKYTADMGKMEQRIKELEGRTGATGDVARRIDAVAAVTESRLARIEKEYVKNDGAAILSVRRILVMGGGEDRINISADEKGSSIFMRGPNGSLVALLAENRMASVRAELIDSEKGPRAGLATHGERAFAYVGSRDTERAGMIFYGVKDEAKVFVANKDRKAIHELNSNKPAALNVVP